MRAVEFAKPVIRATNSDVTLAIDAKGQPIKMLPQFQQQVLPRVDVAPTRGQTPYNRFGSWPLIGWVLLALGLAFWQRRRTQA